jgi:cell wall-associated NlpC family hydrolase
VVRGLRENIRPWQVAALAALISAVAWFVVRPVLAGDPPGAATEASGQQKLPPLPWEDQASSTPPAAPKEKPEATAPVPAAPAPIDPVTGMPAASAGTNGSYTPPPPSERKRMNTHVHSVAGPGSDLPSSVLINGIALPPPEAPDPVRRMVNAANLIVGQPYRLGGGHGSWRSAGYDCSGAVSYALAGAGLLKAPVASGQLMDFGVPGPGRWLTIYANPGHVYAVIAGLRWDTVGDARGSGPRWHPVDPYPTGFAVRHFPGL